MQKKFLIGLVFMFISISAFSQIEYKTFLFGTFWQNGEHLKLKEVESIMKNSPDAYQEFLKGKKNRTLGLILGTGGLALEIYSLIDDDNERQLSYQLGGLALGGVALFFDIQKARRFKKAANIYNSDKGKLGFQINPGITKNGIGLQVNF